MESGGKKFVALAMENIGKIAKTVHNECEGNELILKPGDELYDVVISALQSEQGIEIPVICEDLIEDLLMEDEKNKDEYSGEVISMFSEQGIDLPGVGGAELEEMNNREETEILLVDASNGQLQQSSNDEISKSIASSSLGRSNRVLGLPYTGYKRTANREMKTVPKGSRKIGKRCTHSVLTKKSEQTFLCGLFTDADREEAFKTFWKIPTWNQKKFFIKGLVHSRTIRKRRKDIGEIKKKNEGHDIFLQKTSGERFKVCRKFFISTLDVGEDTYKRWVKREGVSLETMDEEDNRQVSSALHLEDTGREELSVSAKKNINRKTIDMVEKIKVWLGLLPKVPSHYCRASSNKVYVESSFRSELGMLCVYKKWCEQNNFTHAGRTLFTKILKEENIAIYMPRKDQCDLCYSYKIGTIAESLYNAHVKKKNDARTAKQVAKDSASDEHLVLTMDLQCVLLCPKLLASKVYYKQKLQVHNFTFYELKNGDVTLYVWHEANGSVSANEFTTCIIDFISNVPKSTKFITLISDGCNYQNRNKVLASALSNIAEEMSIVIEQLFLERGHTMMEVDSVHATLEKYFKPPINSPSDYVALMRRARPSHPYKVKVLDYSFFRNYEVSSKLSSLRPGKKVGDPVVCDIKALKYETNGEILYKENHTAQFKPLPQKIKRSTCTATLCSLYDRPLSISESKFRHLQETKDVIEKDHHAFFDNLTYKPEQTKKKNSN